eukprot:SAG22_NODE_4770_length_1168_cov_1.708138_1_plen_76_part_00
MNENDDDEDHDDSESANTNDTVLAWLGPHSTPEYAVQDVWTKKRIMQVSGDGTIEIKHVPPNGGSVYVRLDPVPQ